MMKHLIQFTIGLVLLCSLLFNPTTTVAQKAQYQVPQRPAMQAAKGTSMMLWDQTASTPGQDVKGQSSQDFGPTKDTYDDEAADDIEVPAGMVWFVEEITSYGFYVLGGPVQAVNVNIFADNAGLPGALQCAYTGLTPIDDGFGSLTIALPTACMLEAGTWWVSTQAVLDDNSNGQWLWMLQMDQIGNPGVWQNPPDGFGTGCTTWTPIPDCGWTHESDLTFQVLGRAEPVGQCDFSMTLGSDLLSPGDLLNFDVSLIHRRPRTVSRSLYLEVKDRQGRTVMRRETRAHTFHFLDELNLSKALRLPRKLKPGRYSLEVGLEGMAQGRVAYKQKFTVVDGAASKGGLSNSESDLPEAFSLEDNYPNPFNPSTVIAYALPENARVSLYVYDVMGKEVARLVDGYQGSGRYEVSFDASNLAAGTYLYVMRAGDFQTTKRMVLLK